MIWSRQRGRASTARGSSHRTYCGEYTLLTSRKPATTRNASWANRGVVGAVRPRIATRAHQTPMIAYDHTLIVWAVNDWSAAWLATSQMLPRSAVRSELNVQKTFHCSLPVRYAGALT